MLHNLWITLEVVVKRCLWLARVFNRWCLEEPRKEAECSRQESNWWSESSFVCSTADYFLFLVKSLTSWGALGFKSGDYQRSVQETTPVTVNLRKRRLKYSRSCVKNVDHLMMMLELMKVNRLILHFGHFLGQRVFCFFFCHSHIFSFQ